MAMKNVPSTQAPKTEKFDLVVLGSGTGSKVAAWTTAEQGKRVALIDANTSEAHATTSPACPVKTSFTVRRSPLTCAGVRSSAS
jgi:choline dehydrogenase-like flavoprotein